MSAPVSASRDLRWYVARLRAMSADEVRWRAASGLRRQLRPVRVEERPIDWDTGPWPTLVRALAAAGGDRLSASARRIAAGELRFWGRDVLVDPRAVPWLAGPFTAEAAAGAAWALDPKCPWELQRQQHLFALAAGGRDAGDPAWARLAVEQMLDWAEVQAASEQSGYESAHRLVSWAWALPLAFESSSAHERTFLTRAFAETAAVVRARPSLYSSANNHRLAELAGLLAYEAVTARREGWSSAWQTFTAELLRQTSADGGSREQAAGYFLYVLDIVWVAALFAHAVGQELGPVAARAEAMLDWLDAVAGEDGEPPPAGDDAEDRFVRVDYFEDRSAVAAAARLKALLRGSPELFPAAAVAPEPASRFLRDSGQVVLRGRVGSSPVRVVLDAGALGLGSIAAHGHADALAVTVDLGAQVLLRDSGTGSYLAAAGRDRFRATDAHNTVCVDGQSQAEPLGPHLWGRRFDVTVHALELGDDVDYVRASHDGYRSRRSGATHTRSLVYVKPDLVVVFDRVTAERACVAELVWQTPPGGVLPAAVVALPSAVRRDEQGPFSPRYTRIGAAPRTRFRAEGRDVVFVTALALAQEEPPLLELRHRAGETVAEVETTRRVRLVERWTGGSALVERG